MSVFFILLVVISGGLGGEMVAETASFVFLELLSNSREKGE